MKKSLVMLVAAGMLTLTACGNDTTTKTTQLDPASTTITYSFKDSSVPPEYHRSFTFTVADGTGTVVVDSYGDEKARKALPVDAATSATLIDDYNSGKLDAVFGKQEFDGSCYGGQTLTLHLESGSQKANTQISTCGGANAESSQQLEAAIAPLLAPFDIAALTDGRYEN